MQYNINKGGNTLEESEILEPLHACLRELLERDRLGKTDSMRYTDHDIVAVTLMYSHVLNNVFRNRLRDTDIDDEIMIELITGFGVEIFNLTRTMSKVDLSNFYKNSKKG